MQSEKAWKEIKDQDIEYIVLQFTDLFGASKHLWVHRDEWETCREGKVMFDGSSVQGFSEVEDSDLLLKPDPGTLHVQRWRLSEECIPVAAVYCDVCRLDGLSAEGCARSMLKRVINEANDMGYSLQVGIEGEFFLFSADLAGAMKKLVHDHGGYCDVFPFDKGERIRMTIMDTLKSHGFRVEGSHHEVAPGQHEINFKFGNALEIADQWQEFKQIVRHIASQNGLFASFMPKPFTGRNGNAMHCNQSLQGYGGVNAFYDGRTPIGLSETADRYIAGLLQHAKGMAAIANPTVNSYKRLVPGYEAATHVAWSRSNRTALIRIPGARGSQTRVELRTPDAMANPYLLFAVMLKAGLEGISGNLPLAAEAVGNLYGNGEERNRGVIENYPRDLNAALDFMRENKMIREMMGNRSFEYYLEAKQEEARTFATEVHQWEIDKYLYYIHFFT